MLDLSLCMNEKTRHDGRVLFVTPQHAQE